MNYNKAAKRMRKGAVGLRKSVDKMSHPAVKKEALKLCDSMDKSADAMERLGKEAKELTKKEKKEAKAQKKLNKVFKKGKDKKKKRR